MIAAVELERPDICFFLGDGERDIARLGEKYPSLPVYAVRGNCDFSSDLKKLIICNVDGVIIFATHGHLSNVEYEDELRTLTYQAKEAGADIALFGHTHSQHLSENEGITLLNPGSAGWGYYPGYAVLDIENGTFSAELRSI
jgi:putative phosphoesterase